MAAGRIDFQYDAVNDVVVATPHWNIATPEDVRGWARQYETYLKRFKRKLDIVVVLDDFKLGPGIGVTWGEARATLHHQYIGISYAVKSESRVRLFRQTSGVRYDVVMCDAASVEDAIEGIKESRRLLQKEGA